MSLENARLVTEFNRAIEKMSTETCASSQGRERMAFAMRTAAVFVASNAVNLLVNYQSPGFVADTLKTFEQSLTKCMNHPKQTLPRDLIPGVRERIVTLPDGEAVMASFHVYDGEVELEKVSIGTVEITQLLTEHAFRAVRNAVIASFPTDDQDI